MTLCGKGSFCSGTQTMKQISITYSDKSSQVAVIKTKLNTNLFEDRFDLLFLKRKSCKLSTFLWFSTMDT